MASAPNVLCQAPQSSEPRDPLRSLFGHPTGRSYRKAVAQIVRDVKARHKHTNETLAEEIGCSETTIYNAENENGDLAAVTLLRIAFAFKEEAIQPVRDLYLCAPVEAATTEDRLRRIEAEVAMIRREARA